MDVSSEIEAIKESVAVLSDGKLDKNDAKAVVTLLGAVAGIASAVYLALQGFGVV